MEAGTDWLSASELLDAFDTSTYSWDDSCRYKECGLGASSWLGDEGLDARTCWGKVFAFDWSCCSGGVMVALLGETNGALCLRGIGGG